MLVSFIEVHLELRDDPIEDVPYQLHEFCELVHLLIEQLLRLCLIFRTRVFELIEVCNGDDEWAGLDLAILAEHPTVFKVCEDYRLSMFLANDLIHTMN